MNNFTISVILSLLTTNKNESDILSILEHIRSRSLECVYESHLAGFFNVTLCNACCFLRPVADLDARGLSGSRDP